MSLVWEILIAAMLLCSVVPTLLFLVNFVRYKPPISDLTANERVDVLIPARNEEANIAACVEAVLASRDVVLTVRILDDASTDRTAEIVRKLGQRDSRVHLVQTRALPAGWNGKQHACWLLAQDSTAPLLLFLDADVRLHTDAVSACAAAQRSNGVALLSGFPRQITIGWMEKLLLPMIHFVLLAFLPMGRMRSTTKPAFAAGCGQFFLAERAAYFASGGHAAIRNTRHDGLRLPQALRRSGYRTDIVDLTNLAEVRMYNSASAVWNGLAKNATEGLAAPQRIVPLTVILLLGQVLPVVAWTLWVSAWVSMIVVGATYDDHAWAIRITLALGGAATASYLPRLLAAWRFKQPFASALLHPLGMTMLLVLQWYALTKQVLGKPVAWRSRSYATGSSEEAS